MSVNASYEWGAAQWGAMPWGGDDVPSGIQYIAPGGIATAEAFGSLKVVAGQVLKPGGIASAETVPSGAVVAGPLIASGIPSAEAFGGPDVNFAQAIPVSGIASAEALGHPSVGVQQYLSPGGIASAEAIPKPVVGNDAVSPIGMTSLEAFGTPSLNVQQVVSPGGIGSAELVSAGLTVRNTLTIAPSGIASAEAFGTASIKGGAKKINMTGIRSAEAFGIPLIGGNTGLRIFIAGVDRTVFFQTAVGNVQPKAGLLRSGASGSSASSAGSPQPLTMASQTIGRWTLNFDLIDYDGTFLPEMGQTVLILEPGYRHFAGCLTSVQTELVSNTDTVIIHCIARDKSAILDRRVVKTPSYPAGMDIADVMRDIWTNYLDGEGITVNGIPLSLGALINDFVLPGQLPTVTAAYDALVLLFGGIWYIDSYCDLHAGDTSILPTAPFTVDTTNSRGLSVTTASTSYATKVYAVSNLAVQPGFSGSDVPTPAGVSVTETFTLPQASAVAAGFLFGAIITEFPILAITSLKVNGVAQAFYLGTDPYNFRHAWWYFPQTPYIIPPNAQNTNPFPNPPGASSADPMTGDVVEVQYISQQPTAQVQAGDPLDPAGGTCGSGVWEKVVQAQNIQYQGDLDTIAAAQLALYSQIPKLLQLETDYPGLTVGMKLPVNIPRLGLSSTTMLITSINAVSQKGVDIGHGSCFRWTVQAYNTADPGNDLKFWERVIQRSELALPLVQPILPTMVLAPGSSLAGGTVSDFAPLIVGQTAQVVEIAVACNQGPIEQDMLIDLIDSASGSILSQPLKIPAGTGANVVLTFTQVRQPGGTWIYQNETIQPTVAYNPAGINPVAASGVSVQVRGTF